MVSVIFITITYLAVAITTIYVVVPPMKCGMGQGRVGGVESLLGPVQCPEAVCFTLLF